VTQDDFIRLLRAKVKEEGSALKFAVNHDISPGYVTGVLYAGVKPGPKIALALGLKKVVTYEPIK
jgi:hypothetical protein